MNGKPLRHSTRVDEVMVRDPACCREGDTVETARDRLRTSAEAALVVVDDGQRPVAIFTADDLRDEAPERALGEIAPETPPQRCSPSATVPHAERLMRLHHAPWVVVVDPDSDALRGLVTLGHLVRQAAEGELNDPRARAALDDTAKSTR